MRNLLAATDRAGASGSAEQRILRYLDRSDGATRRTLGEQLALPAPTVVSTVTRLVRSGALEEIADPGPRTAGRPAVLVRRSGFRPVLGYLGWQGDTLRCARLSYSGEDLAATELHVDLHPRSIDDLEPAFQVLRRTGEGTDDRTEKLTGVVIGAPAPFQPGVGLPVARHDRPEILAYAPWLEHDPAGELSDRLGVPVLVENNANLGALGESTVVDAGGDDLLFLRVDREGIGAGLVLGGRLYRGATGFAGEIGHIHVVNNGALCACGGRGCLKSQFGGTILQHLQPLYGDRLTMDDVLRLAAAGEPGPVRALTDLGRLVGRRLADLCTFLNPAVLVVAGALGSATADVATGIREQIELYAAPAAASALRVIRSSVGARSEMLGAIALVRQT